MKFDQMSLKTKVCSWHFLWKIDCELILFDWAAWTLLPTQPLPFLFGLTQAFFYGGNHRSFQVADLREVKPLLCKYAYPKLHHSSICGVVSCSYCSLPTSFKPNLHHCSLTSLCLSRSTLRSPTFNCSSENERVTPGIYYSTKWTDVHAQR